MTDLRTAAQQALEALEEACEIVGAAWTWRDEKGRPAITALRAALAQEQAEPLVWEPTWRMRALTQREYDELHEGLRWSYKKITSPKAEPVQEPAFHGFMSADGTQVDLCFTPSVPRSDGTYATAYFTAPIPRPPLTDEEIEACRQQGYAHKGLNAPFDFGKAARAIEKKVRGEKNGE